MTLVILKFIHVATIALWSAGLISLPFIFRQRTDLKDQALYRIHVFTRFFYVALVSPAAFVAVGSGTILIFLVEPYSTWFSYKLVLVGLMTAVHIFAGLTILELFEPKKFYPFWRFIAFTALTISVVSGILALVLGKPLIPEFEELDDFFAPGALSEMLGGVAGFLTAWTR